MNRRAAGLGLALLVSGLVRLPILPRPFEPDEACYALIGREILRGVPLYKGIVDLKPPGLYWAYALGMKMFGFSAHGVHLFCAVYNTFNVAAVWLLGLAFGGPWAGMLAGVFFGIFSSAPRLLARANAEIFMVAPYVLSVYCFYRRRFFWTGVLTIAAMTFKQVAYTNFLFFGLVLLIHRDLDLTQRVKHLAWIAGGGLSAAGLLVLGFWWMGTMHEFIRYALWAGIHYSAGMDVGDAFYRFSVFWMTLLQEQAVLYVGMILFFFWNVQADQVWNRRFLGFWLLTSLLGVSTGGSYLPHYFVQLLPVLCITAGAGFSAARFSWEWTVPALASLAWFVKIDYPYYLVYSPAESVRRQYEFYFRGPSSIIHPELETMAAYIRDHSKPEELLLVLGQSPELYFLSDRRPATRFVAMTIFTSLDPTVYREVVEDFRRKQPLYVVLDKSLTCLDEKGDPLLKTYRLEVDLPRFGLYRRPG